MKISIKDSMEILWASERGEITQAEAKVLFKTSREWEQAVKVVVDKSKELAAQLDRLQRGEYPQTTITGQQTWDFGDIGREIDLAYAAKTQAESFFIAFCQYLGHEAEI